MIFAALLTLAAPAQDAPMDAALADRFLVAAAMCEGKWQASSEDGFVLRTAAEHLPQRPWLLGARTALEYDQSRAIYDFAKALLAPAFDATPEGIIDGNPFIDCSPDAEVGVAVLRWLTGSSREDLRGPSNGYSWLAAAEAQGVGTEPAPESARRNWLRWKISIGLTGPELWADGIDDAVYGNIERAGLLTFLHDDALTENGDAARRILAQHHVASDPELARSYLSDLHHLSAGMRLDFEEAGLLAQRVDAEELTYWTELSAKQPSNDRWRAKAQAIAATQGGGTIPVSRVTLAYDDLFAGTAPRFASRGGVDQTPTALRVLVDRAGKAVMFDVCDWATSPGYATWKAPGFREAWKIYTTAELASLPRPADASPYHWVALPVIELSTARPAEIRVVEEPVADCSANPVRPMPSDA